VTCLARWLIVGEGSADDDTTAGGRAAPVAAARGGAARLPTSVTAIPIAAPAKTSTPAQAAMPDRKLVSSRRA
jgi:hypothetical protein